MILNNRKNIYSFLYKGHKTSVRASVMDPRKIFLKNLVNSIKIMFPNFTYITFKQAINSEMTKLHFMIRMKKK